MQLTQQEYLKQIFCIVDDAGYFFRCGATGLSARSHALQNGSEVVLYYAKGIGPTGQTQGMIWCMTDSLVVQTRQRNDPIIKRVELAVEGE